jgi:hypothetical protein
MARGRPEVPKHMQKKVARQLLERQKRAGVYEKGLEGLGKGFLAGSAYPADIAEMMAKPALTPSASYKAATMRPRGGGIPEVPPPVQDPQLKGTYPYFAKKLGLDPGSAEGIAGSVFSPEPFSKIHALAALGKLGAGKLAGLGMGAAMFGGLKKVGKAEDVAKPIFTSPGKTAAADIAKETIPANKVRSQLEGRGVNKDEMEWTGFNEWIKTKKGEVSKVELEEFFQQNQIEVREVVRGGKSIKEQASANVTAMTELAREQTGDELYALMTNDEILYRNRNTIEPLIHKYREGDNTVRGELDDWFSNYGYDDQNYIDTYFQETYSDLESSYVRPDDVKFGSPSWQLPGGENYRELVLMVPPKKVPWTKENVIPMSTEEFLKIQDQQVGENLILGKNESDKFYWFQTPDGVEKRPKILRGTEAYPGDTTISQESALQNVLNTQPTTARYTGGHYPENDVVAHIRFNERVDPDGNKVLFIEEIQGDWAHKGQEMGFITAESKAARTKLENIAMRRNQIRDEIRALGEVPEGNYGLGVEGQKELDKITAQMEEWAKRNQSQTDPNFIIPMSERQLVRNLKEKAEEIKKAYDPNYARKEKLIEENNLLQKEYDDLIVKSGAAHDVQRGPFVTDTHQWTNLALKRMIRWGSDNGFDSIGWVTGKQSAERYKASKQISKIEYNSNGVLNAYDKSGSKVITEFDVTPEKLVDYIGKEPANKLLKQEAIHATQAGAEHITYQTLKGLDLDIGGEYHKLIYDEVLTAQAKKIGKKHGAKVEKGHADAMMARRGIEKEEARDGMGMLMPSGFRWRITVGDEIDKTIPAFDTLEEAKEYLLKTDTEVPGTVWKMKITDKLKQASKEGMPYYVALPPLVIGAAAQRTDVQRQQSKTDAQAILTQ